MMKYPKANYIKHKYSNAQSVTVVFDGYNKDLSTKDVTHQRRSKSQSYRVISFKNNMAYNIRKDLFLSTN